MTSKKPAALLAAALCISVGGVTLAVVDLHRAGGCHPPAGGRCAGDEPIGALSVSSDGRTLEGTFFCGGRLRDHETPTRVTVTYRASHVGAGGMACARILLGVRLDQPLADRQVVDGVTGRPVALSGPSAG